MENGLVFVNDNLQRMLGELDFMLDTTPVDGVKHNGRAERKLGLITEGAKAAWLEFPQHFLDPHKFSVEAPTWQTEWAEAFSWIYDGINISAPVDDNADTAVPAV